MFKYFIIDEVLKKVETRKINLNKSDCPSVRTPEYNIPARTATTQNQGLSCFVPRDKATVLKNKISVSANGDFCAFWHDTEFTILQDSYALEGKDFELNEKRALYIIAAMYKSLQKIYNWDNKSGWNKIKEKQIYLPIKDSGKIDFDYMESYIAELEGQRIAELEGYLVASGLNDYVLTEQDKEVISASLQKQGITKIQIFKMMLKMAYD